MKARRFRKGCALLLVALAMMIPVLGRTRLMAQSQNLQVINYTTPAVVMYATAFESGTIESASAYDVLETGQIGDIEPREASVTIGTAQAWATADLNSFVARAVTSGGHSANAWSFRELIPHDPQGRGEVTIRFSYKGAASSTYGSADFIHNASFGVYVAEWSGQAMLQVDPTKPSNPIVGYTLPAPYGMYATLFYAYGQVAAYETTGIFHRVAVAHDQAIYDETGEGTSVTQNITSASIRVVPGHTYVIGITAGSNGNSMAVADPVVEVDPSNPDVTIEFPNTAVDPAPKSPLHDYTPESLRAMGFDPQIFADLGFFAPPSDPAPSDPPASDPPPSDTQPPATLATASPYSDAVDWARAPVTVTLAATDNTGGSGVRELHIVLSGASTGSQVLPGNTGSVQVSAEGTTFVSYYAVDQAGNQEAAKIVRLRIDKTPPSITGLPANCSIWPPDHRLVPVATVSGIDNLSGLAGVPSIAVTSNEPDTGSDDGDLSPDIVIAGGSIQLRAERFGSGKGRIYDIRVTATDVAGNSATATATCTVPIRPR